MNQEQGNQGIVVSGGSFSAEMAVAGKNSKAIQIKKIAGELQASGKEEVAKLITELLESIEVHSSKVENKEEVVEAVQEVAKEVNKEKPNKLTLKSLLTGIKDAVGSVAEIAGKAVLLQKAIALMTGMPNL
ncbi:MAG: hypothetical protein F6K54_30635 [Okeania sp. SIO3B5]|uniref:hypothetical protein n=1 Tax=Okeania sp. SIO3B5 TaxID=2607811 RepID=UPI0013FFC087|nr:hypothetical protein [Okeania sp. SIO3B5]NEO57044.1 hypothetical protein [Okeania sp. SIO3B5]